MIHPSLNAPQPLHIFEAQAERRAHPFPPGKRRLRALPDCGRRTAPEHLRRRHSHGAPHVGHVSVQDERRFEHALSLQLDHHQDSLMGCAPRRRAPANRGR